ncbi:TFR_dimer domain-containing protein/Peptidase_M28 domain-containing protein [Cephalotus follicularis]|uniref:glutamate carboxypeptidase II n=1 Tax=Cephalotus follicularis TaxID=3775 RepID=A0A1Q3ANE8_CEPFO|nr:TFR_dimer domain-containing protein/Peptidase_M28 domain-containing protein [Cephalotus follicularis]
MSQPLTTIKSFTSTKPPQLCTYLCLIILCIIGFYSLHHPHQNPTPKPQTALHFHSLFLSSASNSTISSYLRALTLHPHLAGTKPSLDTILYVQTHFQNLNLNTHKVSYKTLLSYPRHSSVTTHFSNGTTLDMPLNEPGVASLDVVQPYHAYSPSGSVKAKVVYVNFGTEEDYRKVSSMGVNVSGCVVVVKKGEFLSRGGVVKVAEAKGAIGVLLYAEEDDGLRGGGIERGTVMRGVGDPLSPGWAGVEGGERLDLEDNEVLKRFPKIPSLPLSLENADVILGSLGGPMVPPEWRGKAQRVGPGPSMVNLTYQGENKMVSIQNVFAVIKGLEEPDRYVLLGNHRDAWTYGAVDPNSGTAALLDIARRYALLMRGGWNPRRTIILCSWDAEEFGMIGSTEWVEQNLVNLGAKAVAYLNVDCAVQGPGFFAGATPQLDNLLVEVTKKVEDPDSQGATVYEKWETTDRLINIQRLSGVDSDFAPFLQHAGVPSVDIYYGRDFPVYHTAFDSYDWMTKHADPFFRRHVTVAGVWGLLGLRLADDSILPFKYLSYADQLQGYKDFLSNLLDESISLNPLTTSIQELVSAAIKVENEAKRLRKQETKGDFVALKIRALNDRLMLAERGFLDADGLQGRQWFKHLVYGPPRDYESKLSFFPGIADAIFQSIGMGRRDGQAEVQHEIWRVARAIQRAASALQGELT